MPRIRNDPNLNICLDYASEDFANTRAQLVNDNTTEEQTVQLLRNIWQANNTLDKRLWQQQVEDDREERAHLERMEEDEQERLNQEHTNEEEDARKEEQKKNKYKYILIQTQVYLMIQPLLLAYKAATKKTMDDDAMILSTLADGSTAWVSSASTHSACSVVKDEDIPFEEFCQGPWKRLTGRRTELG
ncbi:hypothetical protein F4604DRAFT_1925593 [Suillus subluteus]|nr:hypothetical protein F4604DRAFT_1925593 [Suillus subluteus]